MSRWILLIAALLPTTARADDGAEHLDLPRVRADGGLGVSLGDGIGAFASRGHLGASWWLAGRGDGGGDGDGGGHGWRPALRLSAGFAGGVDVRGNHAYYTAAPFAELGVAALRPRGESRGAAQLTVFGRVEPILVPGELGERGLRLGVGVTGHGFGTTWVDSCHDGNQRTQSECELLKAMLVLPGLPLLIAANARHVEVTADLGGDGRRQYGVVLGFGL